MKTLLAVTAIFLTACSSLNRAIDEATYKHYPSLSEADRAECRAKGEEVYWKNKGADDGIARLKAANAYEACMDAK